MKVLSALFAAPLMLIACGDDNGTTSDATSSTSSDTAGDTNVPPGTSALTGVNTNVTKVAPTPNDGCDESEVNNTNFGARFPWGGWTEAAVNYTCNRCPGGHQQLQGEWRAFEYEADETTPNYESPAASNQAEVLRVDGNTWEITAFDSLATGDKTVVARGWYFCSQKPEHPNEHLGWVILEADPAGGYFGYEPNDAFGSDVPLTSSGELLMFFQDSPNNKNGEAGVTRSYCKFGATSNGKTCSDPI